MTFTNEQIEALKAPLNKAFVKERSQAGRQLSYIEGWKAIDEANRIFGFEAWDRQLVTLKECGEARQVGDKWRVAFMATVRITVRAASKVVMNGNGVLEPIVTEITRDGTGYGSGIDKDLGQAYESAIKEAETDAMKRALMTFGNPFGLALYDKEQRNVVDERTTSRSSAPAPARAEQAGGDSPPRTAPSADAVNDTDAQNRARYIKQCEDKIGQLSITEAQLRLWWNNESGNRRTHGLDQAEVDALKGLLTARLEKLKAVAR